MRLIYRVNYSFNKTYYPFFLSPSYKLLSYSNAYVTIFSIKLNHVHTLQIRNPNRYQINDVTLPKFLKSQIEEDKTRFVKEK